MLKIGDRYNKYLIIDEPINTGYRKYYTIKCDCGNIKKLCESDIKKNKNGCLSCCKDSALIGQQFGKLIVEKQDHKINHAVYWQCKCLCGNTIIITSNALLSGNSKSCGCNKQKLREKNSRWTGYGEISGRFWSKCKHCAIYRKHKFEVSIEYAWELFLHQKRKCAFSGIEIKFPAKAIEMHLGTASLDRIDSSKDYVEGNIQWVHKDVNYMKQDFSDEYFIQMCKNIAEYRKLK